MSRKRIRMLPHGHSAINRARALFTARFSRWNRCVRPRAHARGPAPRGAGPLRRRGLARDS